MYKEQAIEIIERHIDNNIASGSLVEQALRMAIDALDCINGVEEVLRSLPPAQPSQDKYEYHYDHTDCIWYRPEARNRCPATCAQYRDGWNDAMNYIFRDGEGYRPFRRDKKYDG